MVQHFPKLILGCGLLILSARLPFVDAQGCLGRQALKAAPACIEMLGLVEYNCTGSSIWCCELSSNFIQRSWVDYADGPQNVSTSCYYGTSDDDEAKTTWYLRVRASGLPDHPYAAPVEVIVQNYDKLTELQPPLNRNKGWQDPYLFSTLGGGPVGVFIHGVAIFSPLTPEGTDAVNPPPGDAPEHFDICEGHPQSGTGINGVYHHHHWPPCMFGWENTNPDDDTEYPIGNTNMKAYAMTYGNIASKMSAKIEGIGFESLGYPSPIIGLSFDGWPVYGPYDADGNIYSQEDRDSCGGKILDDGTYAYFMSTDFPYIIGCYGPGWTNVTFTAYPTSTPTTTPATAAPSHAPTQSPTNAPTKSPTNAPTKSPTHAPTRSPTNAPTRSPTNTPTRSPTTSAPTNRPTMHPPPTPTHPPTNRPTMHPPPTPTHRPTLHPPPTPTHRPTLHPPPRMREVARPSSTNVHARVRGRQISCASECATVTCADYSKVLHPGSTCQACIENHRDIVTESCVRSSCDHVNHCHLPSTSIVTVTYTASASFTIDVPPQVIGTNAQVLQEALEQWLNLEPEEVHVSSTNIVLNSDSHIEITIISSSEVRRNLALNTITNDVHGEGLKAAIRTAASHAGVSGLESANVILDTTSAARADEVAISHAEDSQETSAATTKSQVAMSTLALAAASLMTLYAAL